MKDKQDFNREEREYSNQGGQQSRNHYCPSPPVWLEQRGSGKMLRKTKVQRAGGGQRRVHARPAKLHERLSAGKCFRDQSQHPTKLLQDY